MMIVTQEGGVGPVVSLQMGPSSAPTPIADAPLDDTPLDTDNILINRGGALNRVPFAGVISAAASAAAAAATEAVEADLASITGSLSSQETQIETLDTGLAAAEATLASVSGLGTPDGLYAAPNAAVLAGAIPNERPEAAGFFFLDEVLAFNWTS
jgi:hypothetical protein